MAAGKSAGRSRSNVSNARIDPADPPMTMRSRWGMAMLAISAGGAPPEASRIPCFSTTRDAVGCRATLRRSVLRSANLCSHQIAIFILQRVTEGWARSLLSRLYPDISTIAKFLTKRMARFASHVVTRRYGGMGGRSLPKQSANREILESLSVRRSEAGVPQ